MLSKYDRWWICVNRSQTLWLVFGMLATIFFPVFAFMFAPLIIFMSCRQFLIFGPVSNKYDSLRFIMTLPFSRKKIFSAYVKWLLLTAGRYFLLCVGLKMLLYTSGIQTNNWKIKNGYELFAYIAIIFIYLIILCICQLSLINNFSQENYTAFLLISILAGLPGLFVLYHLKSVLMFFTGLLRTNMDIEYEFSQITKLGLPDKIASIIASVFYIVIITALIVLLIWNTNKSKKLFAKRG